jgi:hypothetical protein
MPHGKIKLNWDTSVDWTKKLMAVGIIARDHMDKISLQVLCSTVRLRSSHCGSQWCATRLQVWT